VATCCHNKILICIHCFVLTVILKYFVLLLELKHNGISSIKIKLTGWFLWPKWGVFTNWILKCDWDKFSALIGGLSLRRSWFIPGLVLLGFGVDKVALEVCLLRGLLYSPVTIIPPILYTHLQLHNAVTWTTKGRIFWIFKEGNRFGNRRLGSGRGLGEHCLEEYFNFFHF